jgi:hypothetical protein
MTHGADTGPTPAPGAYRDSAACHDTGVMRLAPDQLDELADLIAERLRDAEPAAQCLVDARAVGEAIGMTPAWVREHAAELGGRRLGDGPRPRWRFDLEQARTAGAALSLGQRSLAPDPAPQAASRRRRRVAPGAGVELLPVRGSEEVRRAA